MKEHQQYNLIDKNTRSIMLYSKGDKAKFIKDSIKQLKGRLYQMYANGEKRFENEQAFFEEIDLIKKIKDNIVILEENKPHVVSDEIRLLNAIAEMLNASVEVETTLTQKDFIEEEDFAISYECEACGHTEDCQDEEVDTCSECGSDNLIPTTGHENTECDLCDIGFDMWDTNYANVSGKEEHIRNVCEDCYDKLNVG